MRLIQYSFLIPLLCCSSLLADDNLPPLFDASYKLYSKGMQIAVMKRALNKSANNNEYTYRSETQTVGLVAFFHKDHIIEQSQWRLDEHQLYPLKYSYQRTKGKKNRHLNIDFDWVNKQIVNKINDETLLMPLEQHILDKLLYQYAVMRDLQNGDSPDTYIIADGRKLKTYNFELLGEEDMDTPIGTFKTLKILRTKPGSKQKLFLWCALDLQYLPVKIETIEKDGLKIIAIINTLTGMEY